MSDVPLQHGWVPVLEEGGPGTSDDHVNIAHIVEAWVQEVGGTAEHPVCFAPCVKLSNGEVRTVANDRYEEPRYASRELALGVLEAWVFRGSVDVTKEHRRHLEIKKGM